MIKKILALLLCLCMVLPFASCGKEEETVETEATAASTETLSELDAYLASLPEKNFGGKDFNILCTTQTEFFYQVEDYNADLVAQAVYARNTEVNEKYKVMLKYKAMNGNSNGQTEFATEIRNTTSAGEGYDLIIAQNYYTLPLATEGCLHDLNATEYLHWDKPWYHDMINDYSVINGKRYAGSGDLVMAQISNAMGVFYNKNMYADNGNTENLYELVRTKKWTIEKLYNITKDFYQDAGTNGKSDDDTFGIFGHIHTCHTMLLGMECMLTSYDANGTPSVDGYYNDRLLKAADALLEMMVNSDGGRMDGSDTTGVEKIGGGTTMFASSRIGMFVESTELRESEDNIGILPNPLYDEEQKEYYTATMRWELFYIPSNAVLDDSAIILEYLNYTSNKNLIPAYWETAMTVRGADTEDDAEMLNLIKDTLYYDFVTVFKGSMSGMSDAVGNLINSSTGKIRLSSWWGTNSGNYQKALTKLLTDFS